MSAKEHDEAKIGAGHLKAWGAQGLDELRNMIYADSNVAQRHVEYGIYGTRMPSEVAEDRRVIDREFDEEPHYGREMDDRQRENEREMER